MIEGFDEIVLAWEKHELFYKELYEKRTFSENFCLTTAKFFK